MRDLQCNSITFNLPRFLLGLAGSLFVAAVALLVGALIILGTRTEAYLNLEQTLERFIGS